MSIPKISLKKIKKESKAEKQRLFQALTETGFFYLIDHEVEQKLLKELEADFRWFFSQNLTTKMDLDMNKFSTSWRGYFPLGYRTYSGNS